MTKGELMEKLKEVKDDEEIYFSIRHRHDLKLIDININTWKQYCCFELDFDESEST